jgi:hypothetical protein
VEELAVDVAPRSGRVDDEHPGDRRAAKNVERCEAFDVRRSRFYVSQVVAQLGT